MGLHVFSLKFIKKLSAKLLILFRLFPFSPFCMKWFTVLTNLLPGFESEV